MENSGIITSLLYCIGLTNNFLAEWAAVRVQRDVRSYSHRPRLIWKALLQRDSLGPHSVCLHQSLPISALDRICGMAFDCLKPSSRLILIIGTADKTMSCLTNFNVMQYFIFRNLKLWSLDLLFLFTSLQWTYFLFSSGGFTSKYACRDSILSFLRWVIEIECPLRKKQWETNKQTIENIL